jgi:hypothetical protein
MYFANMYCYGHAQDIAGITGIRGCMGIIYVGAGASYAIHIPPDHDDVQKQAREAFETFVKNNENAVGKGQGHLFAFVNGSNRTDAADELKDMKKRLNSPPTSVYRIMKHLGQESGKLGADSVVIMLERVHASASNPGGCAMWYKRADAVTWVAGGSAEDGQYKVRVAFQGNEVPSDLNAHWWRMSQDNCTIKTI